ncbi:hypothetical protein COM08_28000 [Bacillus wiedmannii]|uniref:hypothetical protein n=1 Tax=Bacillus wiedmannii TaxID=1890302 RepID=UPI000BF6A04F|nr:hypothetical protein [Bacillus wiedmannii]PGC12653.1 hypothetical protein COM08_28000 [Bacillus wiedmannii]
MNANDLMALVKFFIGLLPAGSITTVVSALIAVAAVVFGLCYSYHFIKSMALDNEKKRLENQLLEQKLIQSANNTAGTNAPTNGPDTTH